MWTQTKTATALSTDSGTLLITIYTLVNTYVSKYMQKTGSLNMAVGGRWR